MSISIDLNSINHEFSYFRLLLYYIFLQLVISGELGFLPEVTETCINIYGHNCVYILTEPHSNPMFVLKLHIEIGVATPYLYCHAEKSPVVKVASKTTENYSRYLV